MDYAALRTGTVVPTIRRYGTAITYKSRTGDVFTASTGVNAPTFTDYASHGIFSSFKVRDVDGTRVKSGDHRLVIADLAVEPKPGDQVVQGSRTLTVVEVIVAQPGGVAALYEVQVRP